MLILTLKLLLAHLLGDFALQPNKWEKSKRELKVKSPFLYWHILVHAITLFMILAFNMTFLIGIIVILVSHYIIDLGKLYFLGKKNELLLFFADQILHILVITCVA